MKFKILVLCCLFVNQIYSQTEVSGVVVDATNQSPLAFANIIFNNQKSKGTISDIDGKFKFRTNEDISKITVSYLGYVTESFSPKQLKNIRIELTKSEESLDEVVITNAENPALAIIRKVIANKAKNNPENLGGFTYKSYNRTVFDSEDKQTQEDSLRIRLQDSLKKPEFRKAYDTLTKTEKLTKSLDFNIMLMESVTKRKFLPPDLSEEEVIGTRVSGFKNPYFVALATELQPFTFYEPTIDLLDMHFLNPIADGSMKKYDYVLEESIPVGTDTIHIISFCPKPDKNIEGLKGFLHINSRNYGIQNVVAEPDEDLLMTLKIQQKYQFVNEQYWFPEQLNYDLKLNSSGGAGIFVNGKSYIRDIELQPDLQKSDFSEVYLKYNEDAPQKDSIFWQENREEKLSQRDLNTYKVIDSVGKEFKFDKIITLSNKLSQGLIPWGKFDIPIGRLFSYNRYEGFRLGAGIQTNEKLMKNVKIGGYIAYGFEDETWKFGGHLDFKLNRDQDMFLTLNFQNDVREIGTSGMTRKSSVLNDLRDVIASDMDRIQRYAIEFVRRDFKYATWLVGLSRTRVSPQYDYLFTNSAGSFGDYYNTEATFGLRYAHREKIVDNQFQRMSLGTDYPIFNLRYAHGFSGIWDSQFDFNKIEASIHQRFFTKNFGSTTYRLQAGYVDSALPIGLMFTGEGSNDDDIAIVMPNTFQTMLPYEFLSDRYAHVFLTHDFGSLIFKSGNFKPGIILHHNLGWGDLANPQQQNYEFNIKDQVFTEVGLELTKILKIEYLDLYYLGLGVGGFYRYGAYSFDKTSDNFVFKANLSISFD
ncbi:DUF5686 and carboxypeptidase-like regulatory domain-containing protein [Psychroflexus aestuariivivens]|uniref:DUF5686 and carboxypeptidase-like regulatory domain-containing protein n=1 Tax=Psychroflexus aestuariivivens TaxID=1795040 RepID=UPI000FD787AD|nr:DUF5686 and carboxypeptidase-like regulatory domain-containing protein [Psychroflexus aestuariivivens]